MTAPLCDERSSEGSARPVLTLERAVSLLRQWTALDAGSWHADRHARDKTDLIAATNAAIEAASPSPQLSSLSGWMPIETAPRDGSVFVVARFVAGEESEPDFDYELGRYKPLIFNRYEPAGDGLFREVPEQVYDWNGFNNFGRMTHWMPLPPPPQS